MRMLEHAFGIQVCFWSLGPPRGTLSEFRPDYRRHVMHSCAYCTLVKERAGARGCIRSKAFGIARAARCPDGFGGLCHMGMQDWVLPVVLRGRMAGLLYFTGFRTEETAPRAMLAIRRSCRRMGMDAALFLAAYEALPLLSPERLEALRQCAFALRRQLLLLLEEAGGEVRRRGREDFRGEWLREKVLPYIRENYRAELPLTRLAGIFYVNPQYLCRAFRRETGQTMREYVAGLRIEEASRLLRESGWPVGRIAAQVGWPDPNYFSRIFHSRTGLSPREYRRQSRGREDGEER